MKRLAICLVIVGLAVAMPNPASAWFIDFENGLNGTNVAGIPGITFLNYAGFAPLYGDTRTGSYNTHSDDLNYGPGPYHHNGNFWLWAGPQATAQGVKVDFTNNDGTFFRTGYSSFSTFYVTAFLTNGHQVTSSSAANAYGPMGYITVNATAGNFIDYVVLHDQGNYWLTDDMSGDASDVGVPEPGTLVLFGVLAIGAGIVSRKRRRA